MNWSSTRYFKKSKWFNAPLLYEIWIFAAVATMIFLITYFVIPEYAQGGGKIDLKY